MLGILRGQSVIATVLAAAIAATASPAAAQCTGCVEEEGDLPSFMQVIIDDIPGCGTEAFDEPDQGARAAFRTVLEALLACDYTLAASRANLQLYDLVEFTHLATEQVFYVLRERPDGSGEPFRGQGTYVFNPGAERLLNIQAPHAVDDIRTGSESVELFLGLGAAFLQLSGVSRCANEAPTPCDGCTGACDEPSCYGSSIDTPGDGCTGSDNPVRYRESDAAHFVNSFFQVASDSVHDQFPPLVSISVHGFSSNNPLGTSIAEISNGTAFPLADSLSTQLARAYNVILDDLEYAGAGAGSFNALPGDPPEVQVVGAPQLNGNTNKQGRAINGSIDPCTVPSGAVEPPERFLHLEQQLHLRRDPADPDDPAFPDINWNITRDALAAVFTRNVWVEFAYPGPIELGTYCQPYNGLNEGISNAGGRVVRVKAGVTSATMTLSSPAVVTGFNGPAVIGF